MLTAFLDQFRTAADKRGQQRLILEITTAGGDADLGRRLGLEIELALAAGHDLVFVGKTQVFSAGATMMASFPKERRFLTSDTMLLIHARQLAATLEFSGPLSTSEERAKTFLAQLQAGRQLERQGFEKLARGSTLDADEIARRAQTNWYVTADEARSLGLIADVL